MWQRTLQPARRVLWSPGFANDRLSRPAIREFRSASDPEGEVQGVVWTPPGLEVESIGEDFILGVWLDEFDVEYFRRHRLRRANP